MHDLLKRAHCSDWIFGSPDIAADNRSAGARCHNLLHHIECFRFRPPCTYYRNGTCLDNLAKTVDISREGDFDNVRAKLDTTAYGAEDILMVGEHARLVCTSVIVRVKGEQSRKAGLESYVDKLHERGGNIPESLEYSEADEVVNREGKMRPSGLAKI